MMLSKKIEEWETENVTIKFPRVPNLQNFTYLEQMEVYQGLWV